MDHDSSNFIDPKSVRDHDSFAIFFAPNVWNCFIRDHDSFASINQSSGRVQMVLRTIHPHFEREDYEEDS